MSLVSDLKKLVTDSKRVKNAIGSERARISTRLIELQRERQELLHAPLNRNDLEQALLDDLKATAAEGLRDGEMNAILADCQRHPAARIESFDTRALFPPFPTRGTHNELMVLLLGVDNIMAALKPALDRLDYSQAGAPVAQRRARLAEIDRELADLASQKADLEEALGEPTPTPRKAPEPRVGDTMEKIGPYGETLVGTYANPTGHGGGWIWREKEAA